MLDCSWKKTTGLDCPGCGMQRSIDHLIHGDFLGSLYLFPALLPLVFLVLYSVLHIINPRRFPVKWIIVSVSVTAFLMVGNWVFKMI